MTQPTIAQLHNLTNRAGRDRLTPNEQQRLRDGIDQLHAELEHARTEANRYAEAESADIATGSYARRVEELEAALERVRETAESFLHEHEDGTDPCAAAVLAALDGQQQASPEPEDLTGAYQPDPPIGCLTPAPAWTPPPPGDRREQLPPAVLALINPPAYVSTACHTAIHLEQAPAPVPTSSGAIPDVAAYVVQLHARCRINHKFTGQLCICGCHTEKET